MAETESLREKGFAFVWYRCLSASCGGQWLERRSARP